MSIPATRTRYFFLLLILASIFWAPLSIAKDVQIVLNNSFIEQYKNLVSMDASFTIDAVLSSPHSISSGGDDGDIHVAGRAPEIQLPTVVELMNARHETTALDLLRNSQGQTLPISGVWRLWCEHGGSGNQVQGEDLQPFTTTNPDHVFEIHPITKIKDSPTLDSLVPIPGYSAYQASTAFPKYQAKKCHIQPDTDTDTTIIVTSNIGYNYVEFQMQLLADDQFEVADGRMVYATVKNLNGTMVKHKCRMVLPAGSAAEEAIKNGKQGDTFHMLGIPRIDLAIISWRARNGVDRPEVLDWNLPYEIIIVGLYND